jgi:predicted ABC-type transport system involved in lysophospholipase L1 biosynthesis ATPase subunit
MTMIVVSYDRAVGARADRSVNLIDGQIQTPGEPALCEH